MNYLWSRNEPINEAVNKRNIHCRRRGTTFRVSHQKPMWKSMKEFSLGDVTNALCMKNYYQGLKFRALVV
jgi:hypothetical protein